MEIFLKLAMGANLLATEAAAEGGGFGLNVDILETNLINLLIVISILVYFGKGFLSKTLGDRKAAIEKAVQAAENRQKKAAAELAEQQQQTAKSQAEAQQIRNSATAAAQKASADILAKAEQDIVRMRETAAQDLSSEQERVITELRQRVVALALQKVESDLPGRLGESTQQQLIDRSIAMMGGS